MAQFASPPYVDNDPTTAAVYGFLKAFGSDVVTPNQDAFLYGGNTADMGVSDGLGYGRVGRAGVTASVAQANGQTSVNVSTNLLVLGAIGLAAWFFLQKG